MLQADKILWTCLIVTFIWYCCIAVLSLCSLFQKCCNSLMNCCVQKQEFVSYSAGTLDFDFTPRLFHMTLVSGTFEANEVFCPFQKTDVPCAYPFLQSDLYNAPQPGELAKCTRSSWAEADSLSMNPPELTYLISQSLLQVPWKKDLVKTVNCSPLLMLIQPVWDKWKWLNYWACQI